MKTTKNVVLSQRDCNIIANFYDLVNEICCQNDNEDVDCKKCPFTKLCCSQTGCVEKFCREFSNEYFKITTENF